MRGRDHLAILVLGAFLVPACGGGGVSKSEFIAEADAICSRANERVGRRPRAGDVFEVQRPDEYRRVLDYHRNFVRVERAALQELRAREVPAGDHGSIEALLSAFEDMIAYAEESVAALRVRDLDDFRNSKRIRALFERAAAVELHAAAYGFEDCTQLGIR